MPRIVNGTRIVVPTTILTHSHVPLSRNYMHAREARGHQFESHTPLLLGLSTYKKNKTITCMFHLAIPFLQLDTRIMPISILAYLQVTYSFTEHVKSG